MSLFNTSAVHFLEVAVIAIVSFDPIGAVRLVLLANEFRAEWRA